MNEENFQEMRAKRPTKTWQEIHDSIQYTKGPDGLMYPNFQMEDQDKTLDRWGKLAENYLKQNDPSHFSYLTQTGKIVTYLNTAGQRYQAAIDLHLAQLKKTNPAPETSDILMVTRHMNQLRDQARELAAQEVLETLS